MAEVAKLMMYAGIVVITAFFCPFRREREMAREIMGADRFIEVFVDTPWVVAKQRDTKELYKKARRGRLPKMTRVSSPYERPSAPVVIVRSGVSGLRQNTDHLLRAMGEL